MKQTPISNSKRSFANEHLIESNNNILAFTATDNTLKISFWFLFCYFNPGSSSKGVTKKDYWFYVGKKCR